MAEIYHTSTEYVANTLTITRGTVDTITSVGVFHATDPSEIPAVEDFTTVLLVDGATNPEDPLAEVGKIDVLSLVGPRDGDVTLTPGDYQRFVLVESDTESIIRRIDVLTVL